MIMTLKLTCYTYDRYMGISEMQTITSDKWTDDVWGISTSTHQEPLSKLFFYFGQNDHWVADRTRDEIIETRGRLPRMMMNCDGPEMFVCEEGLPHAFCLSKISFFFFFFFFFRIFLLSDLF